MTEIYFNKELSDISFEVESLDEWKKIAEELGMDNQLSLTKGKSTPVPYPYLNEVMTRVYETLCPRRVDYKAYNKTPIPLDILKQIAFSVRDKHFSTIEIWSDDKNPDPLAVGTICKYYAYDITGKRTKDFVTREEAEAVKAPSSSIYETDVNKYLIGRWGDELRPFAELKKLAIERFIENESGELSRNIAELTQKFNLIKENTISYFNGNISKYQVTK